MYRRTFLAIVASCALLSLLAQSSPAATLDADTMKAALRTATPEENGFIDLVLNLVDGGTLPVAMVDSTFQWARQKPKHKFQYFKRGLTVRAARIGIDL